MQESYQKFKEAYELLSQDSTTIEKFESIRKLISGVNPRVDLALKSVAEAISKIQKLQKGEVVALSAEALPEGTEEGKKRKRAILILVKTWKDLKAEVDRVKGELESNNGKSNASQTASFAKIAAFSKGPLGIVTITALAIVIVGGILKIGKADKTMPVATLSSTPAVVAKVQVIIYKDKKIPVSELELRTGTDCNGPHYHAKNKVDVIAVDGTKFADPGGCAFGRAADVKVEEI